MFMPPSLVKQSTPDLEDEGNTPFWNIPNYFHSMTSQKGWLFKPACVVFHIIDLSPLYTQHMCHMRCSGKHESLTEFQPQVGWKEKGHPKMIIQHAQRKGISDLWFPALVKEGEFY